MRIKQLLATTLVVAIFLSACSKKSVVLSFTDANGEVPTLGNFRFRFNQSLVKDSMLNVWDSADYISFEPAIPGKFRWESPDELVFSPSGPLNPATSYTAKVKKAVLKYSKYNSVSGGDKINFHTPDLTLDNSQITWIGESGTTAVPQLDLYFNYRIRPEDIKDRLNVEVDGKKVDYNLVTQSPDNMISVRILGLKAEDKDFDAKVIIEKGLRPENGKNAIADNITTSLAIPSPYVLTIQNVEAEHDGAEGVVKIVTSQQLAGENVKSFISFDPELAFTVETAENGFTIRSDKFDMEKSYAITIAKNLRGKIGGMLKEEYNGSVAFGELEANISFTNTKAVYLSKKGGKNVEVKLTNVGKVKLVISKIYESNLLMSERYGYYPQETRARQASYSDNEYDGEEYGNDSYGGGDATLGDVIYEKEIDTRSLPKSGAGRLLNFSQFEDRLPDFKGVYHVMIRSTEDYWVKDSRYISLSDLGLIAKEGQDKVYVFTNSLKTAEPVNGVTVAVYANNNQLIGTGSTNAQGCSRSGV